MIRVTHNAPFAFPLRFVWRHWTLAVFALGFAACGGEHSHRSDSGPMGPGDGDKTAPTPRMEARGLFFAGQLEVETLLARAGAAWARDADQTSVSADSKGGGGSFSGGSGGSRGGGRHGGGNGRGEGGGGPGGGQGDQTLQAPPIHASNGPVIQLRLRLTNHGPAPVVVEVVDFDSALGNFVVQPEMITVQSGASIEADPMVSRLGINPGEIPLTVKLKIAGRTDQQVLTLKVVTEAPPATPQPLNPSSASPTNSPLLH